MSSKEGPIFTAGAIRCVELTSDEIPSLQSFLEANPEYYIAVNGSAPGPDEARHELEFELPDGWSWEKKWLLGFLREDGSMIGAAGLISNLFAEGVWHIGLFMVATSLHGSGTARRLYEALESWIHAKGARWIRLGVVEGNGRAERFWERSGYVEVRRRLGVEMGSKSNNVRVMAKSLRGGTLGEYLDVVPRDRPESQ